MSRSKWKFSFFDKAIWKNIFKIKLKKKINIFKKIYSRSSSIPKIFVNSNVSIHKGKVFKKLNISKFLIGYKFGEFSFSRKPFFYPIKTKKKNIRR